MLALGSSARVLSGAVQGRRHPAASLLAATTTVRR